MPLPIPLVVDDAVPVSFVVESEATSTKPNPYVASARASAGLGWGSLGFGARAGIAGEYWLAPSLGVGFDGALSDQTTSFGISASDEQTVWLLGPVVTLRGAPAGAYLFASLGAGYAGIDTIKRSGGLCILSPCSPDLHEFHGGYEANGSIGWLAHPGSSGIEIGPVLHVDVVGAPAASRPIDALVTMNLAVGFAVRAGRD